MDSLKFDRLTRMLASQPTRRNVVRGVLGMAAITVAAPAMPAAASCVDVGSNDECSRDGDCCGSDNRCHNKRCECKSGYRVCRENGKEQCFDRRNDDQHCGGCNRRCKNGNVCVNGSCKPKDEDGNCTIGGFCGVGRAACCAGFRCAAGQPELGLGGCVLA